MLRIWQMSGQELCAVSMDNISDVEGLEGFSAQSAWLPHVHATVAAQWQELVQFHENRCPHGPATGPAGPLHQGTAA